MSAYSGPGLVNHKVKVAVRLRPFIEREKLEGARNNWVAHPTEIIHVDPDTQIAKAHAQQFVFDNVFGPDASTRKVYDDIVAPIVNEAFNGFNGTVLCYGQTSSGKTHTLYGTETDPGIIPFLADDIQKRIESVPAGKVVVRLNLIEIYNENVKDLLCSENPIELVERDGTVVPLNAEHIDIFSGNDIIQAAKRLQRERRIGETRMNSQSSRSHTILRMTINTFEEDILDSSSSHDNHNNNESRMSSDDDFDSNSSSTSPGKRIISAFLNFVDLAGSEKASQTGASGERLREAGHINTSLSALSKVVSQLSKQYETANKKEQSSCLVSSFVNSIEPRGPPRSRMPPNVFVSYRDSKLTRLLQSSLAGDALIAIVANATPASSEETLSTLRFALSAKEIQTKPKRNLITDKLDKLQYESTIKELQAELFGKNEELKILRLALSEKNAKQGGLHKDEVLDRRNTFHFRTHTGVSNWGSLSMIEENEIPRHPAPLSADEALKEFRELTMVKSPPTTTTNTEEDNNILPPPRTVEQEIQTDLIQEDASIPLAKKRKFCNEDTSTPKATLRLQKSLLSMTYEEDLKNWQEEKELVTAEIGLIKSENQQLLSEMKKFKDWEKEKEHLEAQIDLMKFENQQLLSQKNFKIWLEEKELMEKQIGLLKSENEQLLSDAKNLKTLQEEKELLDKEIGLMKSENQQLFVEVENFKDWEKEKEHLAAEIDLMKFENQQLLNQDSSKNWQEEKELLAAEIDLIKSENQHLLSEVENFKNMNELGATEIDFIKSENQQLLSQLENFKNMNELGTTEIDLIKSENQQLLSEVENFKNMNELGATEIDFIKSENQQLLSQVENFKNMNELGATEIDFIKSENQQLLSQVENFKNMNELVATEMSDIKSENQQLLSEVENFRNMNELVETEMSDMKSENQQLLSEVENFKNMNELVATEMSDIKSEIQQLLSEVENLNNMIENKDIELKSHEAELTSLRAQSVNLKYTEKLEEDLRSSWRDNKTLENQISELETLLVEKEQELASQVSKIQEVNHDDMIPREEFDQLRKSHEAELTSLRVQLEEDMQSSWRDNAALENQISELKTLLEEKEQDLAGQISKIQEFNQLRKSHEAELTSLRVQLEEVIQSSLRDNAALENRISEMRTLLEEKEQELSGQISKIQEFDHLRKSHEAELTSLRTQNVKHTEKLEKDIQSSWRDNAALENQISELKNLLKEKEQELAGQISKIQELNLDDMKPRKEFDELIMSHEAELISLRAQSRQSVNTEKLEEDLRCSVRDNKALENQISELKTLLEDKEQEFAAQVRKIQEFDQLRKSQEAELTSLRAQSVNMKYTEKLKEDLRSSWRDNKALENQISELKTLLGEKEHELAGQISKIQELNLDDMKPRKEFDQLSKEADSLRMEVEKLQIAAQETERQLKAASQQELPMKPPLGAPMPIKKKINRGLQTPEEWDLTQMVTELKKNLRVMNRDLEQAQKNVTCAQTEKRVELGKLEKEIKEKISRIEELEQYITNIHQEKENLKERQVDAGIQCQYILELVERSSKGENVILPPEYPNVGTMKSEMNHLRNKVFQLQSVLRWCKCEAIADKKQRLLSSSSGKAPSSLVSSSSSTTTSSAISAGPLPTTTRSGRVVAPPPTTSPLSTRSSASSSSKNNKRAKIVSPPPSSTSPRSTRSSSSSSNKRAKITSPPSPPVSTISTRSSSSKTSKIVEPPPPPPPPPVVSPRSTRSSASASNPTTKTVTKQSKFIVKGEEEFKAKADDFLKWLDTKDKK